MRREEEGMKQVSLDNFGENTLTRLKETTTMTVREFDFTEPLRRCRTCKVFRPLSEFRRIKSGSGTGKYVRVCKECRAQAEVAYRENNPEKIKATGKKYRNKKEVKVHIREWNFLYKKDKTVVSGFFNGTGSCLICGEFHPLVLENHHVYPQYPLVASLCANCHKKYHTGMNQVLHMQAVLRAIENTPHLWKDMEVPSNVLMFKTEDAEVVDVIETFDGKDMEVLKK